MDFLGEVGACQPCTSGRACTKSFNLFPRTVACIAHAHTTSMWTNRLKLQCTFTQTNMFATWDPEWVACVTHALAALSTAVVFVLLQNYRLITPCRPKFSTELQICSYIYRFGKLRAGSIVFATEGIREGNGTQSRLLSDSRISHIRSFIK